MLAGHTDQVCLDITVLHNAWDVCDFAYHILWALAMSVRVKGETKLEVVLVHQETSH